MRTLSPLKACNDWRHFFLWNVNKGHCRLLKACNDWRHCRLRNVNEGHCCLWRHAMTEDIFVFEMCADYRIGHLSYPNFVRGPSVCWDATLIWSLRGTWHPSLGNPWSSITCRKSKGSIVAQSVRFRNMSKSKGSIAAQFVKFCNIPEAKKGMIM